MSDIFYDAAPVKEFRKRYRLEKLPGTKYLLQAILKAYKEWGGKNKKPNIAILEFRQPFQASESGESAIIAEMFRRDGLPVEVVSPEQLEYRDGVLRRGDFAIDLIFRRVKVQEFLVRFDLSHPLLRAYRDRAVCMVNSFRSELAQKKAIFDLLTDEEITADFPAAERRAIKEFVPWTRVVQETKTKYRNRTVDLPDFILHNRNKLVLRPNDDGADQQSFRGSEVDEAAWEKALRSALRNPYVVQEALDPVVDVFPVLQYGHLEMQKMRVDVHPHSYLGKVQGCSSWLTAVGPSGFSTLSGDCADVYFGTEVAAPYGHSSFRILHLCAQIRHACGVARIRHVNRHRVVHPIVRRAIGVVRRRGDGVFAGAQIAAEREFDPHASRRPRSFPYSTFSSSVLVPYTSNPMRVRIRMPITGSSTAS